MSTDIWVKVRSMLHIEAKIPNWTYAGQGQKQNMTVVEVTQNAIKIESPTAEQIQNVPRNDFMKVWEVWLGYKAGRVKREEIRKMTHCSKYSISIFKWME